LAGSLVLKGGTALNLGFGEPPRLSVDLDFNLIGVADVDSLATRRPIVLAQLDQIARRGRYRFQTSSGDAHAGFRFFLAYPSALGGEARLKLDVNFLHRVPLGEPTRCRLWMPDPDVAVEALVVSRAELLAGKIVALLDRAAPRDLYDVARLAEAGHEVPALRPTFVALSSTLPHPLHRYGLDRLARVTESSVVAELHPMLRAADRPSAKALSDLAARLVAPLLLLTPPEREFVDRVDRGEIRGDLRFPDDARAAARIEQHPAVRWKAAHAGKRSTRGSTGEAP
jgi:hypothetical protein